MSRRNAARPVLVFARMADARAAGAEPDPISARTIGGLLVVERDGCEWTVLTPSTIGAYLRGGRTIPGWDVAAPVELTRAERAALEQAVELHPRCTCGRRRRVTHKLEGRYDACTDCAEDAAAAGANITRVAP